jgi:uncharacterized membrane protein
VEVDEIRGELGEHTLLPEPNSLSAGAGISWIMEGWSLMQGSMGAWIGMGVVWFLILFALGLVPIIGGLAQMLLTPVFIAGLAMACRAKEQDEEVFFNHLFAGFSNRMGSLMTLGLIYFLFVLFFVMIMVVVLLLMVGPDSLRGISTPGAIAIDSLWWVILLSCLVFIPLVLVQWLAPQLVALHAELSAWEAFKLAVRGMLHNLLPFTVSGIAFSVLGMLAMIPLGFGLLLLIPLGFCTFYAAYRDIFIRPR